MHADSFMETPGCHFFVLLTLVTALHDLPAKTTSVGAFCNIHGQGTMPSQRGMVVYIYIYFFCNHHGWIWSLACSLNHPSLRSSPDPTALWGKAENADSSASSSKREEQGRFPPGLAVTLPAQGSGVAFMMLLATLSQGWDELALHKQECHRQW